MQQNSQVAGILGLYAPGDKNLAGNCAAQGQLQKIEVTLGAAPAVAKGGARTNPGPRPSAAATPKADARIEQLEHRIAQLEQRLAALEQALQARPQGKP